MPIGVIAAFGMGGQTKGGKALNIPLSIRIDTTDFKAHRCAKGKSGSDDWLVKLLRQPIEASAHIVHLCRTIVDAFTQACATKVEAQHRPPKAVENLHRVIHDFVMHGAATERVRMAKNRGEGSVRLTMVQQRFEAPCGTGQVETLERAVAADGV